MEKMFFILQKNIEYTYSLGTGEINRNPKAIIEKWTYIDTHTHTQIIGKVAINGIDHGLCKNICNKKMQRINPWWRRSFANLTEKETNNRGTG